MTTTVDEPRRVAIETAAKGFAQAAERLPTLYSLSSDYNVLLAEMEKPEDQQDVAAIEAEMERLTRDIQHKAFGVAVVITTLENMAERRKAEVKRLNDTAKSFQNHADRLRQYALMCMQSLGIERLETGVHTLAVRQNPPSVNVLDAAAIPSEFQRTKIEITPDKISILAAFKKDGEIVPGTEIVRTPRLSIA